MQLSPAAAIFVGLADATGRADAGGVGAAGATEPADPLVAAEAGVAEDAADADTAGLALAFGELTALCRDDTRAAPAPAFLATRSMADAAAPALPVPACAAPLRLTGSAWLADRSVALG